MCGCDGIDSSIGQINNWNNNCVDIDIFDYLQNESTDNHENNIDDDHNFAIAKIIKEISPSKSKQSITKDTNTSNGGN